LYWARFLSFSLRLVREASSWRWQSYGCDPSMSLASTSFHKPALFLGDLGGTFREEKERERERERERVAPRAPGTLRVEMSAARHADNATCDLFPPSEMTAYQRDRLAIFSLKSRRSSHATHVRTRCSSWIETPLIHPSDWRYGTDRAISHRETIKSDGWSSSEAKKCTQGPAAICIFYVNAQA